MNLIEIGKKPEIQPTETADQMKNLPDTTDKWKQLAKEQAALLELVTEERDELQVRIQKMNEFIQKFQERFSHPKVISLVVSTLKNCDRGF